MCVAMRRSRSTVPPMRLFSSRCSAGSRPALGAPATWARTRAQSLPGILAELDVLVVPSIAETYSLAAREALSAGLPVIASDGGALPEAIEHERNGFLFPTGNVEALAACMQRLIDDPDLLEGLRAGIAPPKTIADDAAEWLQRYQALLASGGPEKTPEHSELGSRALSALLDAV